jgi:hypothetical protein
LGCANGFLELLGEAVDVHEYIVTQAVSGQLGAVGLHPMGKCGTPPLRHVTQYTVSGFR